MHEMSAEGNNFESFKEYGDENFEEDFLFREIIILKTNRFSKYGVCLCITEHSCCTQDKKDCVLDTEKTVTYGSISLAFPWKYVGVLLSGFSIGLAQKADPLINPLISKF